MSDFTRNTAQLFFQNSLAEVVRKLRNASGRSEGEVIEELMADTRLEVKSTVQSVKVTAVQKAMYFHMLGYDASFASFPVIEVMADTAFSNKRVGYVAACTLFSEDTDVLPLMTALLKRDLASANQYEAGLALYCISSVCTTDLAKDLVSDVVNLLNHPRTYVRKKAVLSLYKIFLQHPESLRPIYPKLKAKLEDSHDHADTDPAVRGAVVCVLCELARRNPANYLGLAIPFYSMLSTVHSNWTLIKIVKVFGYFAPSEPRLGKKLVEPLRNLILTTGAKSVQYECILAVANGMGRVASLTKLAAEKVKVFAEDSDQNLKFLGLDAMSRLVLDNPKAMQEHRDLVLRCLDDADITIRCKAICILRDLATRGNVVSTINHLLDRCLRDPAEPEWTNAVMAGIIETAQTDDYELIQDFEWYLGVLLEMSVLSFPAMAHGALLECELVTILLRVNGSRQFGVESLAQLILHSDIIKNGQQRTTQWMVVRAAAFACGEYPYWLQDPLAVCQALLSEEVALLPADAQVCCLSAVGKIASYLLQPCQRHVSLCNGEEELTPAADRSSVSFSEVAAALLTTSSPSLLEAFQRSAYSEVQECASVVFTILSSPGEGEAGAAGMQLYEAELPPVASGAQEALELPEGLDLTKPFCENVSSLMTLTESEADDDNDDDAAEDDFDLEYRIEQQKRIEKARREEVSAFYLRDDDTRHSVEDAELAPQDVAEGGSKDTSSLSFRHKQRTRAEQQGKTHAMNRDLVKPSHYQTAAAAAAMRRRRGKSPEEDEAARRLRHIDVTRSLTADEKLPETLTYAAILAKSAPQTSAKSNEASASSPALRPLLLWDAKPVRVHLFIVDCKVRRDGTRLRCVVEVTNRSTSSALHNMTMAVEPNDAFPSGTVTIACHEGEDGEPEAPAPAAEPSEDVAGECEGEAGKGVLLAAKLNSISTHRQHLSLVLSSLPESLTQPLHLCLQLSKDNKRQRLTMPAQLQYSHFAKRSVRISTDAYSQLLTSTLAAVPVASAFVPCSRAALSTAVPLIQEHVLLTPVDVFKDCMTLYGLLHGRKSAAEQTHVATLLREAEEDEVRGLRICVLCHQVTFAELVIQDIVSVIQNISATLVP